MDCRQTGSYSHPGNQDTSVYSACQFGLERGAAAAGSRDRLHSLTNPINWAFDTKAHPSPFSLAQCDGGLRGNHFSYDSCSSHLKD
jgi:hypothetical protein